MTKPPVLDLDDEALHLVLQLAHVARPVVGLEELHRLLREARRGLAELGRVALEEVLGEERDVLAALAQRRHADGEDLEAVVEVLAEAPLGDLLLEVAVRRRDDAHVDALLLRRADRRGSPPPAARAGASHWSESGISVTSSRKSVPPSAISKSPFLSSCAPVKLPFLWPKSSLSSRFSGIAAQFWLTKSLSRRRER